MYSVNTAFALINTGSNPAKGMKYRQYFCRMLKKKKRRARQAVLTKHCQNVSYTQNEPQNPGKCIFVIVIIT